ncbi:MAG: tyrosine--tRNA ligase [Ilumatobacter sp.]
MDLIADLEARGLIHDSTDREFLRARVQDGPVGIYYGCDPTADSLHVGNLIGLIVLRRFQDAGHRAIALAGGATGMVGDPGGRSEERNLLDDATLSSNVAAIKAQLGRIVDLSDPDRGVLVDNRDWTDEISLLEFLRDVGKHVTVNQMMARESVKIRLESEHGISFTEFSYMLLQANDFLWLHDHLGCDIQIGGSDQWGNIISGVDLIRRKRQDAVHAFSWPLLKASDGTKLGKTTGARTWLDPAKTSPYQLRQYFMQIADEDVRAQMLAFSLRPVVEIEAVLADHAEAPHHRAAQRALAHEVTALVHGDGAAAAADEAADVLFGSDPSTASLAGLEAVAAEVPSSRMTPVQLEDLLGLLVAAGLATSNSDARRTLEGSGYKCNGATLDANSQLSDHATLHGRYLLLQRGKKSHHLVEIFL